MTFKQFGMGVLLSLMALGLVVVTQVSFGVTGAAPVIPSGHYLMKWEMDGILVAGNVFNRLWLEGDVTDSPFISLSGMLVISASGGANAVHVDCFKNSGGGVYCTLFSVDHPRYFWINHDGTAGIDEPLPSIETTKLNRIY